MTDTDVSPDAAESGTPEEDNTPAVLRSWGISGEPVTWADVHAQPVIVNLRLANTGFADAAAVQAALDAQYPDAGYDAADLVLAHVPSGEFSATPDADDGMTVSFELAGDEDLGLPSDAVLWDFGDGGSERNANGATHTYAGDGDYTAHCTVAVAGSLYSTTQEVRVGDPVEVEPAVDPGVAERPATVFESTTDELPNASNMDPDPASTEGATTVMYPDPEPAAEAAPADEPYDPGAHTVDEVLAYVAEHPDEADAIYAAESAGKARVTILDKM